MCDLLRATLAGAPCPPQWRDADDLLGDVHLVGHNTLNRALAAAESHQRRGAAARASTARAWQVVFAAGKRKTLAAADIRAALEGPG